MKFGRVSDIYIILLYLRYVGQRFNRLGFLYLLIIQLALSQIHLLAPEVFHSEPHPAQLYRIELLDFVVKFALWVFERADDQPQSVD